MRCLGPVLLLAACAAPGAHEGPPRPAAASDALGSELSVQDGIETRAPAPDADPDAAFLGLCPFVDAGLSRVARRFARAASEGQAAPNADEVGLALREEGAPYPWPHAWSLRGQGDLRAEARERLASWLDSFRDGGARRCGIALETRGKSSTVAAVAADALADLEALPGRVRTGSWLSLNARLLVPAQGAKVVILGPRGAPKPLPTSLSSGEVRARFALDAEGPWLVQVLADLEQGPRPVLEALVIAGNAPRSSALHASAPGEDVEVSGGPVIQLGAMLERARRDEGLPRLAFDDELARLAQVHAEAQRRERRVAHDLGAGDPEARTAAAGLMLRTVAENVAHADSLALAHRALWRSPSHRANLLNTQVDSVGIGVAEDSKGGVWVCELFGERAR
jgi:hypothetical protein